MLQFAADAGSAIAIFAHGGGEPVFEVGVEAVLRLARLQVEKARIREPARPNSEDENEMPMPASGAASPSFRVSNRAPESPPTFKPSITLPTEPTVSIRPQKVPSRPRNTSKPVM